MRRPTVDSQRLLQALRDAGHEAATMGAIRSFASDHRAFRSAGISSAYGLSVYPQASIPRLTKVRGNPLRGAMTMTKKASTAPPPFDTYHSPLDNSPTISAEALALASTAVVAIVAAWDRP